MPRTLIGPENVPRSGSLGYERASVVSDSGDTWRSMSYAMNFSPYVIRPPPVACVGVPGPSMWVSSAFDTRTSSHDESSTARPCTIPPSLGKAG